MFDQDSRRWLYLISYSYSDIAYLRYERIHEIVVRWVIFKIVVKMIDFFQRRIEPKVPNMRSCCHMHFLTLHARHLLFVDEQDSQNQVGHSPVLLKM